MLRLFICSLLFALVSAAYRPGWHPRTCLEQKYRPSNVSVDSNGFHITGQKFTSLKGIGYSPIPPSKFTFNETFDYFTSDFSEIWERDLPLMVAMGINTIRVWTWNAFWDHTDFLNACLRHNVFVLIPFMFIGEVPPDLSDPDARQQLFVDWKAFVQSQMSHPAVLGFLIGNELNTLYAEQKDELFSAINVMIQIRDEVDDARHPVSVPLSDQSFISDYVTPYYNWTNIDFWSLQIYRNGKDGISTVAQQYYTATVGSGHLTMKPLVLTEFGNDALQIPDPDAFLPLGATPQPLPENLTKQAENLCQMFHSARSKKWADGSGREGGGGWTIEDVIQGIVVMEWNDEWWKGTKPDVRNQRCPNMRSDLHTYCAVNVSAPGTSKYDINWIHEEWLGLAEQQYDSTRSQYCIRLRPAYNVMQQAYQTGQCNSTTFNTRDATWYCAKVTSVWKQPGIVMVLPMVLIILANIAVGIYLRKKEGYPILGDIPSPSADEYKKSCEEKKVEIHEETLDSVMGKQLRSEVGEAFLFYCNVGQRSHNECPYFLIAQERIIHMIWDKYLSYNVSTESALHTATRVVYEQYMEGYYLWQGKLPPPLALKVMLKDLALYTILSTWAGTINHAPEKMFEIFDFSKNYFDHVVHPVQSSQRVSDIQDFHHGLVEIFRVYCLKVDVELFTFEDVNSDAVYFRKLKLQNEALAVNNAENYKKDAFGNVYYSPTAEINEEGYISDGGSSSGGKTPRNGDDNQDRFSFTAPGAKDRKVAAETDLLPFPKLLESAKTKMDQHPYLEYHPRRSPEEVTLSTCATFFFKQREKVVQSKWFNKKFTFPQRGGPLTLLLNYSWVVRIIMWQGIFAWYFQPSFVSDALCLSEAFMYLAVLDSIWNFLVFLFHIRVLGRFKRRTYLEATWAIFSVTILLFTFVAMTFLHDSSFYTSFVGLYLDSTSEQHSINFLGYSVGVAEAYLLCCVINVIGEEARLFLRQDTPYPIRGRFQSTNVIFRMRLVWLIVLAIFSGTILAIKLYAIDTIDKVFENGTWPNFGMNVLVLVGVLGAIFLPRAAAKFIGQATRFSGNQQKFDVMIKEEANYLAMSLIFWGVWVVGNFMVAYFILIPSVENIQFSICYCDPMMKTLTTKEWAQCQPLVSWMCILGVAFCWISASLVSFVCFFAIFELEKLVFGVARAKYIGVGNVQSWADVDRHFDIIKRKAMTKISLTLLNPLKQNILWNNFIDHLHEDCLLNKRERKDYRIEPDEGKHRPNFSLKPRSSEAERRIIHFLWTLESMLQHSEVGSHNDYRRRHRVRTMPTWTVLVPTYNEPIWLTEEQLKRNRTEKKQTARISEIEYLVHTLPQEWDNFAEKMKDKDKSWVIAEDNYPIDLLNSFLELPGHRPLSEDLIWEIRYWATMRGQTLARTIAGLVNCHRALVQLAMLEDNLSEQEATRLASRKYQILITHQTYDGSKNLEKEDADHEHGMEMAFRCFKHFDLVYNNDKLFQSCLKRLRTDVKCVPQEPIKFTRHIKVMRGKEEVTRKVFNYFPPEAYEYRTLQRVSKLKIGEGKAENQIHAVPFGTGVVFQAIDMNQYATIENGWKIPYCLSDHFNNPFDVHGQSNWDHHSIIPPIRILGFPEHTYTRCLSLIGDMMGAAEWCFVTISQRTLVWPLRIRAHYGHPDFFDGFWVRNRGGSSKASLVVNTNEDIFAGYEMIGRGERGAYIEFIEYQKGRETAFANAFVFEGKLAQGGAQQIRSLDVYRLNRKLDFFNRCALFYSSLAFYITNLAMAISVNYYILSIALFAMSGISYHKLGLLDAVIAVPWLFQIGYVMAMPMICELIIQQGLWVGLWNFFKTLPPSVLFFIFHMRTKTYYFTQGLLVGKGGYRATGRGFGLDRSTMVDMYQMYSESHFHEALLIFFGLAVYAIYGPDPLSAFLLRTFTICLIVISWFWAPVFFNPAWNAHELQVDTHEMVDWLGTKFNRLERLAAIEMSTALDAAQHKRLLSLIDSLEQECRQSRGEDDEVPFTPMNEAITETKQSPLSKTKSVLNPKRSRLSFANQQESLKAVREVHSALVDAQKKVRETLTSFKAPVDDKVTAVSLMNKYWGISETQSWQSWWFKCVLLMQWESEDEFFPGLINLTIQKCYIVIELFSPWIILSLSSWYPNSAYFLLLVIGAMLLSYLVDHWLQAFHEHNALMKASMLLTVPFAIGYFQSGYMTFSQLVWSMVLYYLSLSLLSRAIYGGLNTSLKKRVVGLNGNPYHVDFTPVKSEIATATSPTVEHSTFEQLTIGIENRIHEMEALNDCEKQRLQLFLERSQFPHWLASFRRILPVLCMGFLTFSSVICVIMAELLNSLLYNGRVSDCWKKAAARLSSGEAKKPPPPPEPAPPVVEHTRSVVAASLLNSERPKTSKVNKRLHQEKERRQNSVMSNDKQDSEIQLNTHGSTGNINRSIPNLNQNQDLGRWMDQYHTFKDEGTPNPSPKGSVSKSPVSFLDIFSKSQAPTTPVTQSLLPKK